MRIMLILGSHVACCPSWEVQYKPGPQIDLGRGEPGVPIVHQSPWSIYDNENVFYGYPDRPYLTFENLLKFSKQNSQQLQGVGESNRRPLWVVFWARHGISSLGHPCSSTYFWNIVQYLYLYIYKNQVLEQENRNKLLHLTIFFSAQIFFV